MIKAVLFDLDNTLLNRTASLERFVSWHYKELVKVYPDFSQCVEQSIFCQKFIEYDSNGHVWKDIVYQKLIDEFSLAEVSFEISAKNLLQTYVDHFQDCCVAMEGCSELLMGLSRNYRLGIITNGPSPFQEHNITALKLPVAMDVVLVSAALGMRKPDSEIFLHACDLLKLKPEEVVFVGDNPEADVAGANKVGMTSIFLASDNQSICDNAAHTCGALLEVRGVLARLG